MPIASKNHSLSNIAMKKLVILFILPALLRSQLLETGDVKCHNDFSEDGFASNQKCQVSFKLSSDNGCPVVTSDTPRYSSVGTKFYSKGNKKVEKVKEKTAKASNPVDSNNCRFDGDQLVCNCGSDLCNKDKIIIWNTLVKTKFELSDACRRTFIETAWAEINKWSNNTVVVTPTIENPLRCLHSNSSVPARGDYCVATFIVMPGTCYILGYPVLSAKNYSEEECISKNTVRISCNSDNCNGYVEMLKNQIADGMSVFGDGHIVECKKQLEQSIDDCISVTTMTTSIQPTTTQVATTSQSSTFTQHAKEQKCEYRWATSNRPESALVCFKTFDLRHEIGIDRLVYPIKMSAYESFVEVGYKLSKDFCVKYHNATLPTIEYESDMEAIGGEHAMSAFVGARCFCTSTPCGHKIYDWETLNGTKVPVVETEYLKWYDRYSESYWGTTKVSCIRITGRLMFHAHCGATGWNTVTCMKEAT